MSDTMLPEKKKIDVKLAIAKLWGDEEKGLEGMLRYIAEQTETKIDDVAVEVIDKIQGVILPDID